MLKRAGFNLFELNKLDIGVVNYIAGEQRKYEEIKRYLNCLDMADSFLVSANAIFTPKGKSHYVYKRWHKKIEMKIKKILGSLEKEPTIWDNMKKVNIKSKKILLN